MVIAREPDPRLADPRESIAVLIGTAQYDSLTALPTVERNLTDLRDLLLDDVYWGLPADRCVVLANPRVPHEIEAALRDAAERIGPRGLFLAYYAGHGIAADGGELHLSVRTTEPTLINSTSVPYRWIRDRMSASPARSRVVILDCCYAARALETMDAGDPAAEVEIDRAAVLVAASRTNRAFAPADEEHTAFTGELIRVVKTGLPGGPDLLDLQSIWRAVHDSLRAKGRPLPQLRAHNPGVQLVRNAARGSGHRLTGQVLTYPDGPARFLVLDHRPDQGALAVRIDQRTDRPVRPFLGEWVEMVTQPKVLFAGGPLAPFDAFGVAVVPADGSAPSAFRPLAGRVGVLALGSDPRPARQSGIRLRIFVGYYGWGPGQLEAELSDGRLVSEGPISEQALGYE
jgi:caspase domain-containing protein/uncharacterized protein DUF179 (AlgH-like)